MLSCFLINKKSNSGVHQLDYSRLSNADRSVSTSQHRVCPSRRSGFTLVELAIVLVIIGLLVGGVLVGRDLINQAGIRSTVMEISRINVAVAAFRAKFRELPGDIGSNKATNFGLAARNGSVGRGDSNGRIESNGTTRQGLWGESALVWVDLSAASMISQGFETATDNATVDALTAVDIPNYLPVSRLTDALYYHLYSYNGRHYYLMSRVTATTALTSAVTYGNGLNAQQAHGIDGKVDDGLGGTGTTIAVNAIASNSILTGTGTATDCLNADNSYNRAEPNGLAINCRLAVRGNF